jgi:hypothetical protein
MSGQQKYLRLVWLSLLGIHAIPALAGGPNFVTGYTATQPGQPYRWTSGAVSYRTDLGSLGNQTNSQANTLVTSAFQTWQNVPTASLNIQSAGQLGYDVTATNIDTFMNTIGNCTDTSQPANSIIYDQNGGIITALGYDNNSTLGFAESFCFNDTAGAFNRGWALLNGRFIDGQPNTTSHQTVTLDQFKSAFIHEFGHLLGLDHSQVNLNCLTGSTCSADDLAGVPIMFPFLLNSSTGTLSVDDQAAISALYPSLSFSTNTGRIQGHVLFADGQTPAQGLNVIARQVGNPRRIALSSVSGFLYTIWPGNPLSPSNDTNVSTLGLYGSRDENLIGFYDIPGLPPGNYTIEVEAINSDANYPFIGSSAVGAFGFYLNFQFKMPGACAPQYLNYPSAPTDNCSAKSTMTAGGGYVTSTNTDIIILGTQPRYDQWEDGP